MKDSDLFYLVFANTQSPSANNKKTMKISEFKERDISQPIGDGWATIEQIQIGLQKKGIFWDLDYLKNVLKQLVARREINQRTRVLKFTTKEGMSTWIRQTNQLIYSVDVTLDISDGSWIFDKNEDYVRFVQMNIIKKPFSDIKDEFKEDELIALGEYVGLEDIEHWSNKRSYLKVQRVETIWKFIEPKIK